MNKGARLLAILGITFVLAAATGLAQPSGEELYKAKCLNCHGPAGLANSGVGKLMKVKPVTDPAVRKMSEEEMINTIRLGSGKMQAYKGSLSESEIRTLVFYFRGFIK